MAVLAVLLVLVLLLLARIATTVIVVATVVMIRCGGDAAARGGGAEVTCQRPIGWELLAGVGAVPSPCMARREARGGHSHNRVDGNRRWAAS